MDEKIPAAGPAPFTSSVEDLRSPASGLMTLYILQLSKPHWSVALKPDYADALFNPQILKDYLPR